MAKTKKVPPNRTRNAVATRRSILNAARSIFSSRGYDQVGVREIAQEAGVTAALVNRYFGSKQGLFAEVMEAQADLSPIFQQERATFGQWFAHTMVTRPEGRDSFDPLLVILRSAPDPEARKIIRSVLENALAKPLAEWLGGANASERAGLILAFVFGFYMMRNVIGTADLLKAEKERLVALMAPTFQRYVDPPPRPQRGTRRKPAVRSD